MSRRVVIDDGPDHYLLRCVTGRHIRRFAQLRVERRPAAPPWIEQLWQRLEHAPGDATGQDTR